MTGSTVKISTGQGLLGLAFVMAGTVFLWASGPDTSSILMPYQGRLDSGGAPVNAAHDLRFSIYANATGGAALWTETHTNVTVAQGSFAVLLGNVTVLPQSVFDGPPRHLGVEVRPAGAATFVQLNNRSVLGSVPSAVAARATRGLTVDGTRALETTVDNYLVLNPGGTFNGVRLNNQGAGLHLTNNWQGTTSLSNNNAEISNDTAAYKSLMLVGNSARAPANTRRLVTVFDDLDVPGGTATVRAVLDINGSESLYVHDVGRYTINATYNTGATGAGQYSRSVQINQTRLEAMCGDEDGCSITLSMRGWENPDVPADASYGPIHFHYRTDTQAWRLADPTVAGTSSVIINYGSGRDNDGAQNHALRVWNCYFSDFGAVAGNTVALPDNAVGMFLHVNNQAIYTADCVLTIDD